MAQDIQLEGGPHAGALRIEGPLPQLLGLAIDAGLGPTAEGDPFAIAVYELESSGTDMYVFKGFQRPNNEPFPVELVDGPCRGIVSAPQPAQCLADELRFCLRQDNTPFDGKGNPAAVAIYERRHEGARCYFALKAIDGSPEAIREAIEDVNEQRLTQAVNNFYASPDYDIYTIRPTGEHPQVPVEVGHRRGHVDEKIAPLIAEAWRLGLDTLGSCQERPRGSPNQGKAYLGFPRMRDARSFHRLLTEAGIPSEFVEKKVRIARAPTRESPPDETFELDAANVLFASSDIARIVEVLRGESSLRL